ncbi:MAG: hypothetical protein J7501_03820 [Bdellovibrio sp.]|nr:hypothetical protein [Bdellovibrio sp.]
MKNVVAALLTLIMGLQIAMAAPKKHTLKVRQPQKVATVHNSWQRELNYDLLAASASAENLDEQLEPLMNASGLNFIQKWKRGIDESELQNRFAKDVSSHLETMATILKMRSRVGSFNRLNEFEFQNLIRRSDYILALSVSRTCLEEGLRDEKFAKKFKNILAAYNQERVRFDQKMITLVSL